MAFPLPGLHWTERKLNESAVWSYRFFKQSCSREGISQVTYLGHKQKMRLSEWMSPHAKTHKLCPEKPTAVRNAAEIEGQMVSQLDLDWESQHSQDSKSRYPKDFCPVPLTSPWCFLFGVNPTLSPLPHKNDICQPHHQKLWAWKAGTIRTVTVTDGGGYKSPPRRLKVNCPEGWVHCFTLKRQREHCWDTPQPLLFTQSGEHHSLLTCLCSELPPTPLGPDNFYVSLPLSEPQVLLHSWRVPAKEFAIILCDGGFNSFHGSTGGLNRRAATWLKSSGTRPPRRLCL